MSLELLQLVPAHQVALPQYNVIVLKYILLVRYLVVLIHFELKCTAKLPIIYVAILQM
jgi:hypothetical protein